MMVFYKLLDSTIVRDDGASEAKFVAQQFGQDGRATGAGQAVNRGIRVHDRCESGVANHGGKGFGVNLAQLTRATLHRTPIAPSFGHGIAQEVLARGGHSLAQIVALQTLHVGRPDNPREYWVFSIGFLYSSPARIASDVENGSQRMPRADCQHLGANNLGYLFDKSRVPG